LAQSAIGNRYLWQGREYSWQTGLYFFRARWYDPITGRWLSNDPIGINGGLNQYVFCGDNPVNFRDPFGLCKKNSSNVKNGLDYLWNSYPDPNAVRLNPVAHILSYFGNVDLTMEDKNGQYEFNGGVYPGDFMGNIRVGYMSYATGGDFLYYAFCIGGEVTYPAGLRDVGGRGQEPPPDPSVSGRIKFSLEGAASSFAGNQLGKEQALREQGLSETQISILRHITF
jgi:RHS repeat-associated protein